MSNSTSQLLEILSKELKFIFELKKQSSCSVQLTNNTNHHVAFKVKTTSPKKYSVRPNVGVIMPKSVCEFTVTMQAQKVAPPDMNCKDKFLIQSTVVPSGTTEKDITSEMFARDDSKYIEEIKLRVALISPPQSPVLSPINGMLNQGISSEIQTQKDPVFSRVDIPTPPQKDVKGVDVKVSNIQDLNLVKNEAKAQKVEVKDHEADGFKDEVKPAKTEVKDHKINSVKSEVKPVTIDSKDHKFNTLKIESKLVKSDVVEEEPYVAQSEALKPRKADDQDLSTATKEEELKPKNVEIEELLSKPAIVAELKPNNDVVDNTGIKPSNNEELKPMKGSAGEKLPRLVQNEVFPTLKDLADEKLPRLVQNEVFPTAKDKDFRKVETIYELKLVSDIEEMKTKLNLLESKLAEAESTISTLIEERRLSTQNRKSLQEELVRSRTGVKRVQAGFPLLYVVMVALVSIVLGYISGRV